MALAGAAGLGAVIAYFAATGRFANFREAMVDTGVEYAGDLSSNLVHALALAPLGLRLPVPIGLATTVLIGLAIGMLAWIDPPRRRCWSLLAAYALGALVAAGLPGKAYAHYVQLLVPPLCIGLGWLLPSTASNRRRVVRWAPVVGLGCMLALLAIRGSRDYLLEPEARLTGMNAALALETQRLGRRLGAVLMPDEVLYQVGEETGLYWYSGKRPTVTWGVVQLVQWPQAARLAARTMAELPAHPPTLIVAANRLLPQVQDHPLFGWVKANYRPVEPVDPDERRHFTFYVPNSASPGLVRRLSGADPL
jgi:hypothetical protein